MLRCMCVAPGIRRPRRPAARRAAWRAAGDGAAPRFTVAVAGRASAGGRLRGSASAGRGGGAGPGHDGGCREFSAGLRWVQVAATMCWIPSLAELATCCAQLLELAGSEDCATVTILAERPAGPRWKLECASGTHTLDPANSLAEIPLCGFPQARWWRRRTGCWRCRSLG